MLDVRRTFLEEDPPRHGEIRSVIEDHFTTRAVRAFEGAITVLVDQVLDAALEASGPVDAVADLAQPVPIRALGRMLGVDEVRGSGDAGSGQSLYSLRSWRPMIIFWMSEVPSPMSMNLTSRIRRSISYSLE